MEILKLKEEPWGLFRDLLKEICKGFPAPARDFFVRVSCPWDESNAVSVSLDGFILLEEAEAAMESTEQNLELVVVDLLNTHLLTAVASRLARQQGKGVETRVVVHGRILILGEECANALSSVMQHCSELDLRGHLEVDRDIRKEGWTALREALSWRLHDIPHLDTCFKGFVASARREDLRAIWECISLSWKFRGEISPPNRGEMVFEKQMGDEGLAALERFVDLTQEEWRVRKRARLAIRFKDLSVNGQPVQHPFVNAALEMIVVKVGEVEVEVQMQEPGNQGFNKALQQAMLFHPAFGPQPEVDHKEEGQVEVGEGADQVGQVPHEIREQVREVDDGVEGGQGHKEDEED